MLFLLSEELISYKDLDSNDNIQGLKNLLIGGCKGHHMVLAKKRDVVKRLIKLGENGVFDNQIKGYLKKMESTFASQSGMARKIVPRFVVPNGVTKDNKYNKYIELKDLCKFSFLPTTILAENVDDAFVYEVAGRHAINQHNYKIEIRCDRRGGGGSSIDKELSGILDYNNNYNCLKFCLSITDSDKKYPNCPISKTTKKCMELVKEQVNQSLYNHYELPVREIENLIPIKIIEKIIDNKGIANQELNDLKNIINNSPDVRIYGDIKEGTYFKCLHKKEKDGDELKFIENIIQQNNIKKCDCFNKQKCKHYIIPKVCKNICLEFKNLLTDKQCDDLLCYFDGDWKKTWLDIGEVVLEFCCTDKIMRS